MPTLQQGRIIWAAMPDPNGRNLKDRPGVIVTATDEIGSAGQIVVVAITGTLEDHYHRSSSRCRGSGAAIRAQDSRSNVRPPAIG